MSFLVRVLQKATRGTEQRGALDDHVDRHRRKELGEPPLALERLHEAAIGQYREDAHRNAAGQVHAARREDLERQVPCFRPEDDYEGVESGDT